MTRLVIDGQLMERAFSRYAGKFGWRPVHPREEEGMNHERFVAEVMVSGGICRCGHASLTHYLRKRVKWWRWASDGCDVCDCLGFQRSTVETGRFLKEMIRP